jgi:secreted hydrolase
VNISVKHVSACAVSALFVLAAGMTVPAATAQAQKITWENCPSMVTTEGAQCGHIEVPMDYSNPAGEKISVGFVKVPATNQGAKRGALFINSGGPGGDVYGYTASKAGAAWPAEMRAEWDLIGVQPRGLVGSTPVECENVDQPSPTDMVSNVGKLYHDACAAKSSTAFLNSLTTENTARDWDEVRKALELNRIGIMGLSYGTILGSTYATLFPQHTDKVILDSGIDTELLWNSVFDLQRPAYVRSLHEYFAWIARNDATYHLGATPYAVYEKWAAAVVKESGANPTVKPPAMEPSEAPLGSSDLANATKPLEVQIQNFLTTITQPGASQQRSATLQLTRMLVPQTNTWNGMARALNGTGPSLTEIAEKQQQDSELTRVNETSQQMQQIILCNENHTPAHTEQVPAFLWNTFVKGDAFDQFIFYSSGVSCGGIQPVATVPQPDGSKLATRPLQIQGIHDPQTPYGNFTNMQQRMNSQLITVNSFRHGHVGMGNDAVDKAVVEYLRTGNSPITEAPGEPISAG